MHCCSARRARPRLRQEGQDQGQTRCDAHAGGIKREVAQMCGATGHGSKLARQRAADGERPHLEWVVLSWSRH